MVVIDYGHDETELYDGSHGSGTLTSFKQHTQFADFLQAPGECDITAHVDLTAVTRAAERGGLDVLGRLDQTYFMLGLGIARSREHVTPAATRDEDAAAAWRPRQHAQGSDLRKGRWQTARSEGVCRIVCDSRNDIAIALRSDCGLMTYFPRQPCSRRIEPFWTWHTRIVWTGYILLVDGMVYEARALHG